MLDIVYGKVHNFSKTLATTSNFYAPQGAIFSEFHDEESKILSATTNRLSCPGKMASGSCATLASVIAERFGR